MYDLALKKQKKTNKKTLRDSENVFSHGFYSKSNKVLI